MYERLHVDLFSGIGGFALAARANGVRTVQFCEIDARCRAFLARAWPGVPCHDDIRTFHYDVADAEEGGADTEQSPIGLSLEHRRSPVWLLTGGVPCQPASRAGKQRGAADDRWLWPEAVRVLAAIRPTWALFENPPGIGDVGLAGILAEVEAVGYEVRVLGIPACAVGAPHRRERYWIICRLADPSRDGYPGSGLHLSARGPLATVPVQSRAAESEAGVGQADSSSSRREGPDTEPGTPGLCAEHRQTDWSDYVWLPCADGKVRRAPDDSIGLVDGLHRSLLGALGNSIVPQVAARIIAAMIQAEEEET